MRDVVIRVENLSKEYHLGTISHGMLSRDIQSKWAKLLGREDPNIKIGFSHQNRGSNINGRFWALKDVTFNIHQGEIVGIIGHNGAGKSTLLKILSRVTSPTMGSIKVKGRVASLLEVGTGFHPELTGRENVFLNGAILGMRKGEIEEKFEEIVQFSEIDRFVDTPVKRYSSGMYVRLAFAVAAHLDPDILVVDEVLAVGDTGFQKKCLGKMGEVSKEGNTVLIVSHNLGSIHALCEKCILLDQGHLIGYGPTNSVITQYLSSSYAQCTEYTQPHNPEKQINLRKISLLDTEGNLSREFRYDESFQICIEYEVNKPVIGCYVWLGIRTVEGVVAFETAESDVDEYLLNEREEGYYKSVLKLPPKWLNAGDFNLFVAVSKLHPPCSYDRIDTLGFSVMNINTPEKIRTGSDRHGIFQPFLKWECSKMSYPDII